MAAQWEKLPSCIGGRLFSSDEYSCFGSSTVCDLTAPTRAAALRLDNIFMCLPCESLLMSGERATLTFDCQTRFS